MSTLAGADAGSRILDICTVQDFPPNVHDTLVDALRRYPQDTANALRRLHRERTPLLGVGDFSDAFSRMAATLTEVLHALLPANDRQMWETIIGSDLLEVYIGIISSDAFFFESQSLIDNILNGLSFISMGSYSSKAARGGVLWARGFEPLWKCFWDNRHLLRLPLPDNKIPESSVIGFYLVYSGLACKIIMKEERHLNVNYLPHMGLYLFSRCDPAYPNLHMALDLFNLLGNLTGQGSTYPSPKAAIVHSIFREAILEDVGADTFLHRVNGLLAQKPRIGPKDLRGTTALSTCTRVLLHICAVAGVAPLMETHQCLSLALAAVRHYRYSMPIQAYDNVAMLLYLLSNTPWEAGNTTYTMTIPGEAVVAFLACGLELYVADHDLSDDAVCSLIVEYTAKAKAIQRERNPSPHLQKLLDGFQAGVKVEWWPTLRYLQEAAPSLRLRKPRIQSFTEKWVALGTTLGLDATKERQRQEREMRRHCSWRECQYHKEELPEAKLKACAGCGETRYCGRDCQKSDWTKGSHKQRCRRLK